MLKIKMTSMLVALATVLAPMARGQSTPQPKITGVLATQVPNQFRNSTDLQRAHFK
jgi:hypothetical protein